MKIKREDWEYIMDCVRVCKMTGYEELSPNGRLETEKQYLARGNEIEETDYLEKARNQFLDLINNFKQFRNNEIYYLKDLYEKAINQLQEKLNV